MAKKHRKRKEPQPFESVIGRVADFLTVDDPVRISQQRVPLSMREESRRRLNEWGREVVARAVERQIATPLLQTLEQQGLSQDDWLLGRVRRIEALRREEDERMRAEWARPTPIAVEKPKPRKLPIVQPVKRVFNFASD